jgi:hypothetical protein
LVGLSHALERDPRREGESPHGEDRDEKDEEEGEHRSPVEDRDHENESEPDGPHDEADGERALHHPGILCAHMIASSIFVRTIAHSRDFGSSENEA